MKIAFFTEGEAFGKVPRNFPNMRTDMAWMCALDASRIPYKNASRIDDTFDLGICIIPKEIKLGHQNAAMEPGDIEIIKTKCKKIAAMQEGPQWYFQDYPLDKQIWFFNTLQEMDFLLVHNEIDKKYYEGLTGKQCRIMPSLMIEDSISSLETPERSGVIIGGNFCSWYGGFDSYMMAQEFDCPISIPSMGRKIEGEDQLPNLNHLPFMMWIDWIKALNNFKYGIHLMRTHAAGTFALNCAYLGIPCIGYEGLDTQELCHPSLTVKVGDLNGVREKIESLKDEDYYFQSSKQAKFNYNQYYTEQKFKENFLNDNK